MAAPFLRFGMPFEGATRLHPYEIALNWESRIWAFAHLEGLPTHPRRCAPPLSRGDLGPVLLPDPLSERGARRAGCVA